MTDFQPHGGTGIEVRGRVLVYKSKSHMNEEEVQRLHQETAERLRSLGGGRWGVLRLIDRPVLLTPEAEEAAKKVVAQRAAGGLVAQAVVFLTQEDRALVEDQTARLINDAIPLKFFDRVADAEAWLNSVIAEE
jgi:hypothetical protein